MTRKPSVTSQAGRPGVRGQVLASPRPLCSMPSLKGTCPVLLLSLPSPLETFPRCTYGITVLTLQRKQLKPCYNSLMLTSEWGDYPPLQKATCLFNAVFTCLKVNFIKSLSLPMSRPGSSPLVAHWGLDMTQSLVDFPGGNTEFRTTLRSGLFHFLQSSQFI